MTNRRSRAGVPLVVGTVALVVIGLVAFYGVRWSSQPEQDSYTSVQDTSRPAKGQVQRFSDALRARGMACSDEYTNDLRLFSRGCYRTDFDHDVAAEFAGSPDGTLGYANLNLDYIGADDAELARSDFDAIVRDFVAAAGLTEADAKIVSDRLAAHTDAEFTTGWGSARLTRGTSSSAIVLRGTAWRPPNLAETSLGGSDDLRTVVVQRGYDCTELEPSGQGQLECTRKDSTGTFKVNATLVLQGITRLYLSADTGRKDTAMKLALAELGGVLDELGDGAEVKEWFTENAGAAGGRAYVDAMHAYLSVTDQPLNHFVQFDLISPCRTTAADGGIC